MATEIIDHDFAITTSKADPPRARSIIKFQTRVEIACAISYSMLAMFEDRRDLRHRVVSLNCIARRGANVNFVD